MDAVARSHPSSAHAWRWFMLLAGLVAALYVAGPLRHGAVYSAISAAASVAIVAGVLLHRPSAPRGWLLLAAGQVLAVAADIIFYNYDALFGTALPFPSLADPFYLAMYPCMVAGLVVLLRARRQGADRPALIDALVVVLAAGALSWTVLIAPYWHDSSLGPLARGTSMAYPLLDLTLLAVTLRMALGRGRTGTAARMLAVSMLLLLAGDAAFGWLALHGGDVERPWLDAVWLAAYILLGASALHPSMRALSEPAGDGRVDGHLSARRLIALALAGVLVPALEVVRALDGERPEPLMSAVTGALFLLVVIRLADVLRRQEAHTEHTLRRHFETRLAALVHHANDVVSVVGEDGLLAYVSPSGERLLGRPPQVGAAAGDWTMVVHADDRARVRGFMAGLGSGETGRLEYRIRHLEGHWLDVETLVTNRLGDGAVDGLVLNTRDVSERKALERRLSHQASHDALTGLPNRELLREHVGRALARARRHDGGVAVIFLDLDEFKTVNDSLGHAAGDEVLREAARRLSDCTRADDVASRLGGDEFALLLEGYESRDEVLAVAARAIETLARPVVLAGREVQGGASAGIAFGDASGDAESLLRNADVAMYRAKAGGKGRHVVFEPAMHAAALDRLRLEADLRRAVREDEVTIVLQPIVALGEGEIVGAEALARWEDPERGAVSPAEFIPIAEATGLIVPLGRSVLREACRQAAALQEACPPGRPLRIAVNLSARQLQSPELVGEVASALHDAGLEPCRLVLELTESAMMEDVEVAIARLHELRALGVGLAVDDFGTGYSSLNAVRRFPVDILKIDRSFVMDLVDGPAESRALTEGIVTLALTLGLTPLAEGIEDEATVEAVRAMGCDLGQGYHLHRPMPAAELAALLAAPVPA